MIRPRKELDQHTQRLGLQPAWFTVPHQGKLGRIEHEGAKPVADTPRDFCRGFSRPFGLLCEVVCYLHLPP